MVLYAADISKLAVPVKSVKETVKKTRKRKVEPVEVEPGFEEKPFGKVEPVESAEAVEVPKKFAKKKVVKKVEPVEEVEEEVVEVVEPVKKKRVVKKKVDAPVEEPAPVAVPVEEPVAPYVQQVEPKPKRVRKPKVDNSPPAWFQKYVQSVKKEEAMLKTEKVPAKQIKQEAQEQAQKSWDNGLTRDRVTSELDNHMNRMYCNRLLISNDFQ